MYQLPMLSKVSGLIHGFSTREEGNQGFGFGLKGQVIMNRGRLIRQLSDAFQIGNGVAIVPSQHGYEETIGFVGPLQAGRGMMASNSGPFVEAAITVSGEVFLFLAAADCLPIILYDPVVRTLALVHGSRESTVRKIVVKTIDLMESFFRAKAERMVVGIGPGIRQQSYELEWFDSVNDPEWQNFCRIGTRGKIQVDLFGFTVHLLKTKGITEDRIEASPVDTFTDPSFFSHRRCKATGESQGRHAVAVGMAVNW